MTVKTTRREFCRGAAASAYAIGTGGRIAAGQDDAGEEPSGAPPCLDYGRSFICNTAEFNSVRFWVESRTTIFDDEAGASTEFYQCGSCKSEHTFAETNLFHEENYDFLPILGDDHWLVFRRPAGLSERYHTIEPVDKYWGKPTLKLRWAEGVRVLHTWEAIRDATAAGVPIVTQTELADPNTGLRAILECPVKTMNISMPLAMYQVDTGPIAFPDLSQRYQRHIECLRLAFIAFNTDHFADFVVEQPTAVVEDGEELCKVYHYSKPFSLPAKNLVLAAGRGE